MKSVKTLTAIALAMGLAAPFALSTHVMAEDVIVEILDEGAERGACYEAVGCRAGHRK